MDKLRQCDELKAELDHFRPFPPETLISLRNYYRVGLTWSSNALEGNSLTESETKVVLEDGLTIQGRPLRDVYEALGHAEAYDHLHAMAEDADLKPADILKLHELFYKRIDPMQSGRYRKARVFISGSRYPLPAPERIPGLMDEFLTWLRENEKVVHPVTLAAEAHKQFVFIHPFIDGNGRVARLLMNLILIRHGYPMAIIPPILRPDYIALLEAAHRTPKGFIDFIAAREIETLRELLRLLRGETVAETECRFDGEKLLQLVKDHPGSRVADLMKPLKKSRPTVERYLRQLREQGLIEFRGAPKNGGYFAK